MPSTAERVARYLDEDLALKEILARGILNLRRASRWLIAKEGWDATEEAVVSALRRYAGSSRAEVLREARTALAQAEVGLRSGITRLSIPRGPSVHRRLREIHHALDADDTLVLLQGQTRVELLVNEGKARTVAAKLGMDEESNPAESLALVSLSFPTGGPASHMGVAIVLNALAQHGMGVRAVFTCEPEFSIVVEEDDAARAFEAMAALAGIGGGPG